MLGSQGRSPRARVAITHQGQGPRRAPLIEVSWMVCQYSTRSLVSTEMHEMTPETGMKGRGGYTAGVGTVTAVMGGYYPLPRSLTAIHRPAHSTRVLRSRTCGRLYAYDALLERLAQDLQDVATELRQLIEKEHPVIRERHVARQRDLALADEAGVRDVLVGGAGRAGGDQGRAAAGAAGDAVDARGADGLGQGHRRQDGGQPLGLHRPPGTRGPQQQDVWV